MTISFELNGREVVVVEEWDRSLLDLMREDLDVVGAKPGCAIGRCGACTVLIDGAPVPACLVPVGRLSGVHVVTAEGLPPARIGPLLRVLRDEHAAQCGYCFNGLLVTLAWLLRRPSRPDREEATALLSGHLCRCVGHIALDRVLDRILALRTEPPQHT